MIQEFLQEHFALNGISEKRQRLQTNVLLAFEDFCAPVTVEDAGPEQLEKWMVYLLTQRKLHPNSVRNYINMLRPYYGWLQRRGHISRERLLLIRDVKHPKGSSNQSEPNPYSQREIMTFWADLDRHRPLAPDFYRRWTRDTSPWHRVWRHMERVQIEAITVLALYCGLRQGEIKTLTLDDIDPLNAFIPVINKLKGGDVREVPYPESARNRVERWRDLRQEMNPSHEYPWLTLGRYREHYSNALPASSLAEMFHRIGDGYKLHRFRHTCATEWLRAGMPLEHVRKMLGHATINQTLAYAKLLPEDTRRSMERAERLFEKKIEPNLEPPQEDIACGS